MSGDLFGSELWAPALDKYAEATGLTVELFGADGQRVLASTHQNPLLRLFREFGFDPGLFSDCARCCLSESDTRPVMVASGSHGLMVVGTSLILDGAIVGAAVAGYAMAGFAQVAAIQRWARSAGVPFDRLWAIARQESPMPERRLMLYGELLNVLGDALLRENHRTRLYEETVVQLRAAGAAKDEFLAVLSHELRTPLASILGWAGVLQRSDRPDQVRRAAEAIERNVRLQSRMVEDLLDVNRISHGSLKLDRETIELAPVVRAALETSTQLLEKKDVRVELVEADERLFVEGDSGRLQQIFRNIISNAVKFTPAGGDIRIAVSRDGDSARVLVSDTGIGIAPEFLAYVFDIFRQQEQGTRRQHEGLGIGLALVKRLTELHGGTVNLASAGIGHGTEVTVRFPLATEIPALADPPRAAGAFPSSTSLEGLSVLIVEDSEDARESLRLLLKLLGARVSVAADGLQALDVIERALPDAVLCDLRMPRMDGYEFIREMRRRRSPGHLPVVAMSGLVSEDDRRRTRDAGFHAHLMKPFDAAAVVAAVEAAIGQRQDPNLSVRDDPGTTTRFGAA